MQGCQEIFGRLGKNLGRGSKVLHPAGEHPYQLLQPLRAYGCRYRFDPRRIYGI